MWVRSTSALRPGPFLAYEKHLVKAEDFTGGKSGKRAQCALRLIRSRFPHPVECVGFKHGARGGGVQAMVSLGLDFSSRYRFQYRIST